MDNDNPASLDLAPAPAPVPAEAWAVANPPAAAPSLVSWVVLPEEQIRQLNKSTEWLHQNMEAVSRSIQAQEDTVAKVERSVQAQEAALLKVERMTAAAEQNATTMQQHKDEVAKVAQAAAKMAVSLDLPVPVAAVTNAQIALHLLAELAPVLSLTESQVMLRVSRLVQQYRLYYPLPK